MAEGGAVVRDCAPFVVDPKCEFCAPHFFDFSYQESSEDVKLAESWFETSSGHKVSPQVLKGGAFSTLQSKCTKDYVEHANAELKFSRTLNNLRAVASEPDGYVSPSKAIQVSGQDLRDQGKDDTSHVSSSRTIEKENSKLRMSKGSSHSFCATVSAGLSQAGPCNVVKEPTSVKNVFVSKMLKRQIHKPHENGAMIKRQKVEGMLTRQAKKLASPFISMAEKVQKFQTGTTRELRSLCRENGGLIPSKKQKLTLTKPKEPELVTSYRIRASRVKSSAELEEEMLAKIPKFKARPVNKKILNQPTLLTIPKKAPKVPEFEVFHLRTMERALRHTDYAGQPSFVQTRSKLKAVPAQRGKHTQIESSILHHLPTSVPEETKSLDEMKLDKYPKCMVPQRCVGTSKSRKRPIPEELCGKENLPTISEDHCTFTTSETVENEPQRVLRPPRKPLGNIESSLTNRQRGNQQSFTRMALKKRAADMIIKETEVKDLLFRRGTAQPRTTRLQTKQENATERSSIAPGLQVSFIGSNLKRKFIGQAAGATSKKLQFR